MTSTHGNDYPGAFPQGSKAIYSGNLGKGSTHIVPRLLERCHHGLLAGSTVGLGSQWSPGQCQLTAGPLGSWAHLFHSHFFGLGFSWISTGKESVCTLGDLGSIPRLGRSSGEGKGYPLQYSGLENSMDCRVHGIAKNQTQQSDFHFTSLHFFGLGMYS